MAQSMSYNAAAGISGMLKAGHSHWDDAVIRNINAAVELSHMVLTSLGPFGRHKLLVNHLEKMYVTSDCATILEQVEVEHPAARLVAMASKKQKEECGDSTNLVVSFCGELLKQTQALMSMGLHVSEVIAGYQVASKALFEELPNCVVKEITKEELLQVVAPVVAAKQFGSQDQLAPLIVEAGLCVMNDSGGVEPQAVRTVKVLGSNIKESKMVPGYVAQRAVETTCDRAQDCKICVFACGIEASSTEAKGTVLMNTADDLKNYNKSEEVKMEEIVQTIAESGVKLVVTGGTLSEMALHFLDRYNLICLKLSSKWELRRLCQAVGATALVRLGAPTPDEMGFCKSVRPLTLGQKVLTVFENDVRDTKLATIVLRASTQSLLQDLERAVDDGVRAVQQACRSGKCVPGAGATEFRLSKKIQQLGLVSPGLDQYAIAAFATALQIVPRTLAETAGLDGTKMLADMNAFEGDYCGVDLENGKVGKTEVLDLLNTKTSAFQLALDAALTILKVDQIIMSKQQGGAGK